MPMTPQDIQSQQFHVRFRGFDAEEVDNFLEKVSEEYLVLIEENRELHNELEKFRAEIDSYRSREKTFQNAIMSAQQIAEEMKSKSRREAEEIVAAAKEHAREIQKNASAEIVDLESEVARLKNMKIEASQELHQVLRRYMAQLEEGFSGEQAPLMPGHMPTTPSAATESSAETMPAADEQELLPDIPELYERIDLSEEEIMPEERTGQLSDSAMEEEIYDLFQMGTPEMPPPESTVPDLEGDMLFSLEDPLDEGPEISFEEEPEKQKRK
jgi:cell division initiation protein